jgi:hypothetical protein
MITKFKHSLLILITGLSFITANAQTPLENLFRLEGSWAGEATLFYDGNTFNFAYYAEFKKNDESSGMYMDEWFSHPDIGTLKGYNVIGFNARDQKIHWFSVDNFGTCHDHLGYWKTNDHFYMEATEKHGGKKFEEKIDITFKSDDEITLHLIATIGGQLFQDVLVIFRKQSGTGRSATTSDENTTAKKPVQPGKEINGIDGFNVYPNPAAGKIIFQIPNNTQVQHLQLSVFNILGEKIKDVAVQAMNTSLSLIGYKPGTYIYKITKKDKVLNSGKFIVQ